MSDGSNDEWNDTLGRAAIEGQVRREAEKVGADRERRRIRMAQKEALFELRRWFGNGALPFVYDWLAALEAATRATRPKKRTGL